jgi:hypothetical protein
MSEVRELPHEVLIRRYGLNISELSNHTQQLKKDLDKTITFLVNKSKNGKINLTPAVESKIETYDRYICDGIFEFLESKEVITEAQAEHLKDKADDAREDVIDDLKDDNSEGQNGVTGEEPTGSTGVNSNNNDNPNNANDSSKDNTNNNDPSPAPSEAKIGFWDWN